MLSNAADAWRPLCRRASALMRKDFILMPMSIGRNADGYPRLPLATVADEARADCQYASAISPVPSAHNAAEPRTEGSQLCTLMPMSERMQLRRWASRLSVELHVPMGRLHVCPGH